MFSLWCQSLLTSHLHGVFLLQLLDHKVAISLVCWTWSWGFSDLYLLNCSSGKVQLWNSVQESSSSTFGSRLVGWLVSTRLHLYIGDKLRKFSSLRIVENFFSFNKLSFSTFKFPLSYLLFKFSNLFTKCGIFGKDLLVSLFYLSQLLRFLANSFDGLSVFCPVTYSTILFTVNNMLRNWWISSFDPSAQFSFPSIALFCSLLLGFLSCSNGLLGLRDSFWLLWRLLFLLF